MKKKLLFLVLIAGSSAISCNSENQSTTGQGSDSAQYREPQNTENQNSYDTTNVNRDENMNNGNMGNDSMNRSNQYNRSRDSVPYPPDSLHH